MRVEKLLRNTVALALSGVMVFNMVACGKSDDGAEESVISTFEGDNLSRQVERQPVTGKNKDDIFINSQLEFYVDIFKESVKLGEKENILVSPLSIMMALSMTSNGANGETREAMEDVLSSGISIDNLNEYIYEYQKELPSSEKSKLSIANSIWFIDTLDVRDDFLQTNVNYYNADMFKVPFDDKSLDDINSWVKDKTDGMIDKIINEHPTNAVMYLINALAFDAEWETPYTTNDIRNGIFNAYDGNENKVEFMHSEEGSYIHDENTKGFIKPYKDNKYSFVALLPDEDIDILDYIEEFTYEKYTNLMDSVEYCPVQATIPKFSYEYNTSMNKTLTNMGMGVAFDDSKADFSKIGDAKNGNIYIGNVIHKTFIQVDELGTKAGAVTAVIMYSKGAVSEEMKRVCLDRPFVYMIIDNSTNLPVFMGLAMDI